CWKEIDLNERIWVVPASRMKGGREHRIPLSSAAMGVLSRLDDQGDRERVLFASRNKRPLSNMALLMLVRRMRSENLTVHGFRSTFRDWAAERTNFQREVAEAALAHVLGDKVEAAYLRSDLFDKRRRLMDAWGEFATARALSPVVVKLSAKN